MIDSPEDLRDISMSSKGISLNTAKVASVLSRRSFAAVIGGAAFAFQPQRPRPNILWITTEDIGPQLGAYGDRYATTPNLDKLASSGVRYNYAWSNAPVCAPARTCIISGMYANSCGAEHMRSLVPMAPGMKMFPQFLREAGFYASNNSKEDYNLENPERYGTIQAPAPTGGIASRGNRSFRCSIS